jgi:hypothetical protein
VSSHVSYGYLTGGLGVASSNLAAPTKNFNGKAFLVACFNPITPQSRLQTFDASQPTSRGQFAMFALPSKADIPQHCLPQYFLDVRFGP